MWPTLTAGGVGLVLAGGVGLVLVLAGGLLWWALRQARKKGEQNERDRQIKNTAAVQARQLDVAAEPAKHRDKLLDWMRR